MKPQTSLSLTVVIAVALAAGCAKTKAPAPVDDVTEQSTTALADNPNAKISDVLQKMRGRWIKELKDPNTPDPTMMRMFATADNTLTGRMLFAGAFADVGVAAQLVQSGDLFTLTLNDDDERPHAGIPEQRVLTGSFDSTTNTLELKGKDHGEWMKFVLPGGYAIQFSGNVYECIVPHNATQAPPTTGGGIPLPGGGSIPLPGFPGGWPWGNNTNGRGGGNGGGGTGPHPTGHLQSPSAVAAGNAIARLMADQPAPTPAPPAPTTTAPTPTPNAAPPARASVCGMTSSFEEDWSRMSGAGT